MLEARPSDAQIGDALFNAQEKVRDWMHNRLDDDAMDIARLYKSSRDKLIERLRNVYEGFLGEDVTIARARRSGAASLIDHEIDRTSRELTDYIGQTASSQITAMLGDQPRVLNRNLSRYVGMEFGEISYTAQRVLDELTTSIVGGGTFYDHIFNMTDRLRSQLLGHVRTALVNGQTFDELRANILKAYGVGKLSEPAYNAYGAVKVYKNEARRQWNKQMLKHSKTHGGKAVWWATIDADSTEGCVARHGYALDDLDDDEMPPRHYNCRCQIAVFNPDDDLSAFKAEAMVWLKMNKVSRRMAMNMEAGWSWGSSRLMPVLKIKDYDDSGWRYRSIPWTAMPEAFVDHAGEWNTLGEAQASGKPDHVLIRSDGRVRGYAGWRPIAAFLGERTVETFKGYAVDAPDAPSFDRRSLRVPADVFERWPALRLVTFPAAKHDESYAVRVLSRPDAERLALALQPDEPLWKAAPDFVTAVRNVLTGVHNFLPPDAYLAVAMPKHVLGDTVRVTEDDVRSIVSLATGTVLYASEPFDPTMMPTYDRVAVYCPEMDGACWAIRPRGRNFWTLPGGHIDEGENKRDAAKREMWEETGVPVKIVRALGAIYRPWSTTYVYLGVRLGDQEAIQTPDEIDAAAPVSHKNLCFDERAFLTRQIASLQEAFNPSQPRDFHGRFSVGGAGAKGAKIVSITRGPIYRGEPVSTRTQMSKQETGALGEKIIVGFLQKTGFKNASLVNTTQKNFPIDGVAGRFAIEMKSGQISNEGGARRWKATLGEPGEAEKTWLKNAAASEKARWNSSKEQKVMWRKQQAMKMVSNALGKALKPMTMTTIINPDKKTADIYRFEGFHEYIGWNGPLTRTGYVATVKYKA